MIAADTSSLIAYFNGGDAGDTKAIYKALLEGNLIIPPVILAETLSDDHATGAVAFVLSELPLLEIREGYWMRVGSIRKNIRSHGLKAKLADALIAQSCIDHNVPLITRDKDFRHYAKHCGLKLYA